MSRNLVNGEEDPYFTHSSLIVWESLVALDSQLSPLPQLTESWNISEDQLTWTFKLRRGIGTMHCGLDGATGDLRTTGSWN